MSPRELAHYYFINAQKLIHELAINNDPDSSKKLNEFKTTFYDKYVRNMKDSDYIEYLEQYIEDDRKIVAQLCCNLLEIAEHSMALNMELQASNKELRIFNDRLYTAYQNVFSQYQKLYTTRGHR